MKPVFSLALLFHPPIFHRECNSPREFAFFSIAFCPWCVHNPKTKINNDADQVTLHGPGGYQVTISGVDAALGHPLVAAPTCNLRCGADFGRPFASTLDPPLITATCNGNYLDWDHRLKWCRLRSPFRFPFPRCLSSACNFPSRGIAASNWLSRAPKQCSSSTHPHPLFVL